MMSKTLGVFFGINKRKPKHAKSIFTQIKEKRVKALTIVNGIFNRVKKDFRKLTYKTDFRGIYQLNYGKNYELTHNDVAKQNQTLNIYQNNNPKRELPKNYEELAKLPKKESTLVENIANRAKLLNDDRKQESMKKKIELSKLCALSIEKKNKVPNLGIYIPQDSDKISYLDAYSAIRKNDDSDYRAEAYAKLANTYGKNNRKKNNETSIDKLNYYSRRLKALSYYGKKINNHTATHEETELYFALLYNLGKDMNDDDITDYLSDVYEQQKTYQK